MSANVKETKSLLISKNRKVVGSLSRTSRGYQFGFDPAQVGQFITYNIKGTSAPLIESGVNLPAYFANLLPEGLRLKSLVKKIKTSEDDLFSLFAASGQDCIGDITTGLGLEHSLIPLKLKDANFYELFHQSLQGSQHDSISGVQDKISASMINFPVMLQDHKKSYILKLNPRDKPNLVQNEFQCLRLAKKCGLNVANARLVKDGWDNQALLVERFDRQWSDTKKIFEMIHQEDGCQILNLYPSQKYRISINDLAKKIVELVPSPQLEMLSLMKTVAFSYLVGNGDLHAKNLSLFDPPRGPRQMTPAYDLICTALYGDEKLALKIDGFDDNLSAKLLLNFCTRFDIPPNAAQATLKKLLKKFELQSKSAFLAITMTSKERTRVERLVKKRILDLS